MIIPGLLKKQNITEAALIIAIISFISKIFGFFREVLVAKYFGATGQTDAFLIGLMIPSLILGLFSSGIATLIIPFYLEKRTQNKEAAYNFVNSVFMVWGAIFIVLSILFFVTAPFCIRIIAYGLKGEYFNLSVSFARFLILPGILTIFSGMFSGLIQAEKQFFLPTFASFLGNVGLVLSLFLLHDHLGIHSWTFGQFFFSSFTFITLFIVLYHRYKFFHYLNYRQINWSEIRAFSISLMPLVISGGLSALNQVVDKSVASSLDAGSVAMLNFSTRIWQIPISLLSTPVVTAVFPTFSELAINCSSKKEYEYRFKKTLCYLFYFTIPLTVYLFILSEPIIRLFFERGAFDTKATGLTSLVLKMYVLGLFAQASSPIFARAFYSFKNTRTPLLISAICISLNIILNLFFSKLFGVAGIALSTSVVMLINIIISSCLLNKYINIFNKELFECIIKITLSSLPIIPICYFSLPLLNHTSFSPVFGFINQAFKITLVTILSAIPFFALNYIFHLPQYFYIKSYMVILIKKTLLKLKNL